MKKHLLSLLMLVLIMTACKDRDKDILSLSSILTSYNDWKVVQASFGDEEAPTTMYDNFRIRFTGGANTYIITNPDGAPKFNRNNASNSGAWMEVNGGILLDGTVLLRSVGGLNGARLKFEWEVSQPGKSTVTYRVTLVPAQ